MRSTPRSLTLILAAALIPLVPLVDAADVSILEPAIPPLPVLLPPAVDSVVVNGISTGDRCFTSDAPREPSAKCSISNSGRIAERTYYYGESAIGKLVVYKFCQPDCSSFLYAVDVMRCDPMPECEFERWKGTYHPDRQWVLEVVIQHGGRVGIEVVTD